MHLWKGVAFVCTSTYRVYDLTRMTGRRQTNNNNSLLFHDSSWRDVMLPVVKAFPPSPFPLRLIYGDSLMAHAMTLVGVTFENDKGTSEIERERKEKEKEKEEGTAEAKEASEVRGKYLPTKLFWLFSPCRWRHLRR